jgi:hypothetical protein
MQLTTSVSSPGVDGVDPARVPQRTLYTGAQMPAIGLGTFGSDHVGAPEVAEAVKVRRRSATVTSTAPPSTATRT